MQALEVGIHDFAVPPIYDWGSASLSSTRVLVGQAVLPAPDKEYEIDFMYGALADINRGAIAMGKFEQTSAAYEGLEQALVSVGVPVDAVLDRNVLYCKSAAFHEDGAFNTLFATALWHGQEGDVVFPRLGAKVEMRPGTFIVFDCHEPHCFVARGKTTWEEADYGDAAFSHLLSFDLDRFNPEVRELFNIRETDTPPLGAVSDKGMTVCQRTGKYVRAIAVRA